MNKFNDIEGLIGLFSQRNLSLIKKLIDNNLIEKDDFSKAITLFFKNYFNHNYTDNYGEYILDLLYLLHSAEYDIDILQLLFKYFVLSGNKDINIYYELLSFGIVIPDDNVVISKLPNELFFKYIKEHNNYVDYLLENDNIDEIIKNSSPEISKIFIKQIETNKLFSRYSNKYIYHIIRVSIYYENLVFLEYFVNFIKSNNNFMNYIFLTLIYGTFNIYKYEHLNNIYCCFFKYFNLDEICSFIILTYPKLHHDLYSKELIKHFLHENLKQYIDYNFKEHYINNNIYNIYCNISFDNVTFENYCMLSEMASILFDTLKN